MACTQTPRAVLNLPAENRNEIYTLVAASTAKDVFANFDPERKLPTPIGLLLASKQTFAELHDIWQAHYSSAWDEYIDSEMREVRLTK